MRARSSIVAAALPLALLLALLPSRPLAAQQADRAFNVFLDCSGIFCDEQYVRSEIVSVNWVRERTAAAVHVLATTQPTGGGGTHYTLAFIGQRQFAGLLDTLTFDAPPSDTPDETRRAFARTVRLGLVRYLARTEAASQLDVTYTTSTGKPSATAATRDAWNAWVFGISLNGNGSREENYASLYLNGRLSANRVTDSWKTSLSLGNNYNENRFNIDGAQSLFLQRGYNATVLQVKSLGAHWSAGLKGNFFSSTYLNERLAFSITPAVEYDLFPYAESTRRQLRLQYGIGVSSFHYYDLTVYDRLSEGPPVQTFSTAFSQNQTWGSVNAGVDAVSYLNDLARRNLTYSLGANVRIVKGLSLNFFGNYQSIHDQFYIPKQGITRDDALLRQSQQSTRFSQFFFMGLTYSFGSVLNNVVNPRFGGGSGGGVMIMQ